MKEEELLFGNLTSEEQDKIIKEKGEIIKN